MKLKKEIQELFRPLLGQRAWGAKVGWGSFVTIEFGSRHIYHHHYHGDWHLWLYQCDWILKSQNHEMANSESRKRLMQTAIDNLNDRKLLEIGFDQKDTATDFLFEGNLCLKCRPYSDSEPTEECWMLFMPDKQVVSLSREGLKYERKPIPNATEDEIPTLLKNNQRAIRLED